MIAHTITINQIPFSERGTCDVFINSTRVDIEYNVAEGCPTPYSLADVLEMVAYLPKVSAYRI